MDSILNTIKKMVIGVMPINSMNAEETAAFDIDLIVHINAAFAVLTQLGAGPKNGFAISDASATWHDFCGDRLDTGMVISYIYLKTRLVFDPPPTSSAVELMKDTAREIGWRICEAYEHSSA